MIANASKANDNAEMACERTARMLRKLHLLLKGFGLDCGAARPGREIFQIRTCFTRSAKVVKGLC
jgi:hypothetical protein